MTNTISRPMITIDPSVKIARVTQIEGQIRRGIDLHRLSEGVRLPSIRVLAKQCGVCSATVVEAYNRLVAAGYTDARRASGHFVARRGAPRVAAALGALADTTCDWFRDFSPLGPPLRRAIRCGAAHAPTVQGHRVVRDNPAVFA